MAPPLACSICQEQENKDAPLPITIWKCDLCGEIYCNSCGNISPTEVRCLQMKKRTLIFYCNPCRENLQELPALKIAVGELQIDVGNLKANPPSGQDQATLDKIAKALAGLEKSQGETNAKLTKTNDKLEGISSLRTEVAELRDCVKELPSANDYEAFKADISDTISHLPTAEDYSAFKEEIKVQIQELPSAADFNDLKESVGTLKQQYNELASRPPSRQAWREEEILAEAAERQSRARNVIMIGVVESERDSIEERTEDDIQKLKEILEPLGVALDDIRVLRIGKKVAGTPRLLKIVFPSAVGAKALLVHAKRLPGNLKARNDMTPRQREYLAELRVELGRRQAVSDKELTIRFVHEMPKIVEKPRERPVREANEQGAKN